jgi:integrase
VTLDAQTQTKCPECGSNLLYKDGLRYFDDGSTVQRFLCRNRSCGLRFSDPSKTNKASRTYTDHQLGDILQESKKLDTATKISVAGDKTDTKGKFVSFLWTLKKDGIKENTATMYVYILENLISKGADLLDPETVKAVLAESVWTDKYKCLVVSAYSKYLSVFGGIWKKPVYSPQRPVPFLPYERELDCLIDAAQKKLSTYLRLLKETGMRANEAWPLKYIDIDIERNIITLNQTEKHGIPRNFKVTPTLICMLNALPKKSDRVFNGSFIGFSKSFRNFRSRTANKMQNPRLIKIHFHTYRHWFASMLYHKTKDIIYVKERLGHRSVNTTEIYTHLIDFKDDGFHSATAKTVEEAKQLIESGFEYVTDMDDVKLFRKRK